MLEDWKHLTVPTTLFALYLIGILVLVLFRKWKTEKASSIRAAEQDHQAA